MKHLVAFLFLFLFAFNASAQSIDTLIHPDSVRRIISTLASDEMKGRATYTPNIDRAADFIAEEFKKAGLKQANSTSYFHPIYQTNFRKEKVELTLNDKKEKDDKVVIFSLKNSLSITEGTGCKQSTLLQGETFFDSITYYLRDTADRIVWVDEYFERPFNNLPAMREKLTEHTPTVIFIYAPRAERFSINMSQKVTQDKIVNIIGVIPGKSKKEELVFFTAHYDHIGVDNDLRKDSIYNGANDNASGTTALIVLANYFHQLNNNERTLVFIAFSGEELGLVGSSYFAQQCKPETIKAVVNIEMIGRPFKSRNTAYITGYYESDMAEILNRNLKGTKYSFTDDPHSPDMMLFQRSDNYPFAKLGIPAHTIMAADMNRERHYHQVTDEVSTINIEGMTKIIRAIALSTRSIIDGSETPSRIRLAMQ